jgi:hypothetical protein
MKQEHVGRHSVRSTCGGGKAGLVESRVWRRRRSAVAPPSPPGDRARLVSGSTAAGMTGHQTMHRCGGSPRETTHDLRGPVGDCISFEKSFDSAAGDCYRFTIDEATSAVAQTGILP